MLLMYNRQQTNVTHKVVYLPSSYHTLRIFTCAHNNVSQICHCGQISLQNCGVNCSFTDNQKPLVVTFILLAIVPLLVTMIFFSISKPIVSFIDRIISEHALRVIL